LETVTGTLPTGDLSLAGCGDLVCIERKTFWDLISCLCTGRERFTKELQRGQRIPNFSVVVEASYREVLRGDYRSQMTPVSAWGSIIALQERYRIPFYFAGDVPTAAKLTESILMRWFREHVNCIEAATKGAKANLS
jgi:ERCC4-type nuclease